MKRDLFRKKTLEHIQDEVAEGLVDGHGAMNRVLSVRDLTFMGIAAIVGAGIFSTIGKASFDGGPGIILLFLFIAVACGFSAICYAEFASMVPVSGSAYTYSYVAFGELIAWIIGWDLLMEYAIGNIAVAISWSDYFTSLVNSIHVGQVHLHMPDWLATDYWTAQEQKTDVAKAAWANAPAFGSFKFICNLPAFLITGLITWVIYIGIKESRRSTNIMVILKIAIILVVMIAGCFYVNTANWTPFLPNGIGGVLTGTSAVFFSYIGFDAISTTAEECRNPQRDLPRAMFLSLIICTVVYVLVALVLTGMTSYKNLNVGDPLAYVFSAMNSKMANWIAGVISVSAIIATASVLLVFQLGQPRIWMSMSRDGLLPPIFSRLHPVYKTPSFSTLLTGVIVGVPALFMNLNVVVDLTSVGTLFAFVLVCGGILKLQNDKNRLESKFKTPYVNGKWIAPVLFVVAIVLFQMYYPGGFRGYLNFADEKGNITWDVIRQKVPFFLFGLTFLVTTVLTFIYDFSLIPVLGFLSCTYLLSESGTTNWERFLIWLLVGLALYFVYGSRHSKLGQVLAKRRARELYLKAAAEGTIEAKLNLLDEALALDPENVSYYLFRVEQYYEHNDFETALEQIKALQTGKKVFKDYEFNEYNLLGCIYARLGRHEEALEYLEKASALEPYNPNIYLSRGIIYEQMKDNVNGLKYMNMALDLDPDFGAALNNRANYFMEQGDFEAALTDINRAISLDGDEHPLFYLTLAEIRALQHRTDEFYESLETGLKVAFGNMIFGGNNARQHVINSLKTNEIYRPFYGEERFRKLLSGFNISIES